MYPPALDADVCVWAGHYTISPAWSRHQMPATGQQPPHTEDGCLVSVSPRNPERERPHSVSAQHQHHDTQLCAATGGAAPHPHCDRPLPAHQPHAPAPGGDQHQGGRQPALLLLPVQCPSEQVQRQHHPARRRRCLYGPRKPRAVSRSSVCLDCNCDKPSGDVSLRQNMKHNFNFR